MGADEGTVADLTKLQNFSSSSGAPTDDQICYNLQTRLKRDQPYTRIGASTLVVVNPYKPLELLNDVYSEQYAEAFYRDVTGNHYQLEPHIYELAGRVYFHLRRTGDDQAVIFSGITGSGKTTTSRHFVQQLLTLATHTKKEAKVHTRITGAQTVLESFGNARTVQNRNASRFGKFQELQFNERGRITGAKTLTYFLDKSRVTGVPRDERNYHVFNALMAGASDMERAQWNLPHDFTQFSYLGGVRPTKEMEAQDSILLEDLRAALKVCGIKSKNIAQIFQLLAAILHIGNLQFIDDVRSQQASQDACRVKNREVLDHVAMLLGVSTSKLETTLTYKLKLIHKELCTVYLNAQAAAEQRDALARTLYSLLFSWLVESINTRLCVPDDPATFVAILDQFGYQNFKTNTFEHFCFNMACERVQRFLQQHAFEEAGINAQLASDGVALPRLTVMSNQGCMELLAGKAEPTANGGLISLLDRDSARLQAGHSDASDANLLDSFQKSFSTHPSFGKVGQTYAFAVSHFAGQVTYTVDSFLEKNLDTISPDFVNLFRTGSNTFVGALFSGKVLSTESHPKDDRTIVKAQLSSKPMRAPSMKRPKRKPTVDRPSEVAADEITAEAKPGEFSSVVQQLYSTLTELFTTLGSTRLWNVYHIRPNDAESPDQFDLKRVKQQVRAFLLPDLAARNRTEYMIPYPFADFMSRYQSIIEPLNLDESRNDRQKVEAIVAIMGWTDIAVGRENIWLSDTTWKGLEDHLRAIEKEERAKHKALRDGGGEETEDGEPGRTVPMPAALPTYSSADQLLEKPRRDYMDDGASFAGTEDGYNRFRGQYDMDDGSLYGESEWDDRAMSEGYGQYDTMAEHEGENHVEEVPITAGRIWWVRFVWFMTWWIPTPLLRYVGKMDREDVQMAWREKVTLCLLIFLFSAIIIFYMIPFGEIICPNTKFMFSEKDVANHASKEDIFVSVRGTVYDITNFAHIGHSPYAEFPADLGQMMDFAGKDVSNLFPLPMNLACQGIPDVKENTVIEPNITITLSPGAIHYSGKMQTNPILTNLRQDDWYTTRFLPIMNTFKRGNIVWLRSDIYSQAMDNQRRWGIINDVVYDLTEYFTTAQRHEREPQGVPGVPIYHWITKDIEDMFSRLPGTDLTEIWEKRLPLPPDQKSAYLNCLNNVFKVGYVDHRKDFRCQFNIYLLLAISILLVSVILVKFLAALQFGGKPKPGAQDKFVICQVPCYTEDEDSLRKTIDSLTVLDYDDKRKLLFIIADGMIVGSGNDRPTPRIVLDLLGVDSKMDPEPLMFKSIGEGSKQLNYGKVYSGLYECEGHVVPYIFVVKVGKPSERSRPGNRGKRDSQIILMQFLNKVHFDAEMTPLELEIYHQMKNVIGVNPSFYEYIFMVDADTEAMPDSLSRLISCMSHDARIIGICGETQLGNEDNSWTTMIQVYEYFISHHMAKAFESLFGSVTCLPGCFCMYRVRTAQKNIPLIISNNIIRDYSDNHVDTLHKKNLLSLGEDRYLTTLMMKYFPQYKMTFTPHAKCKTTAPDRWHILLSQRRRWINSTIHNLFELMFLPEMCGFCCFSMRFVVFVDLLSTFILPVSVIYLGYLLYLIGTSHSNPPTVAFVMLAAVYGLQAIIFILRRQWQHIGWMIIYLVAMPIFNFFIPIYSFWHFDDFSWGNTRVVVGDNKKKIIVEDDELFDEKMIPMKKWSTYEQEMWELGSMMSHESGLTAVTGHTMRSKRSGHGSVAGSVYAGTKAGSVYGGGVGGGGEDYDYYRDTNVTAASEERRGRSRSPASHIIPYAASVAGSEYSPRRPVSHAFTNFTSPAEYYERSSMMLRPTSIAGMPTDEEIVAEVQSILSTADLMSITKKQVREQLSARFGTDLTARKEFINKCIEQVLRGQS
ncbi:uncharacterized protein VTP21DRAFT_5409 [Calcarisporiella thermophila]|uniref:uncharacterized protein n=1 Tax=Calcarisporiella thermophila TaxID=911321 RepID=UPI0037436B5A